MATKKIVSPVTDFLREGSSTHKAYMALKDGKVHQLEPIRKMLIKAGVKQRLSLLFRLGRILRRHSDMALKFDYAAKTIQMVKAYTLPKTVKAAIAPKKSVKKATSKTKPVAKTKSRAAVKSKAVKKVAVAIGASTPDDDGTEE